MTVKLEILEERPVEAESEEILQLYLAKGIGGAIRLWVKDKRSGQTDYIVLVYPNKEISILDDVNCNGDNKFGFHRKGTGPETE